MKKNIILLLTLCLVACSSGIKIGEIATKIPKGEHQRTILIDINASNNGLSDLIILGSIKTSGSVQSEQLISLYDTDNINIGISGQNTMLNKATVLYSLQHVQRVGNNVSLYMIGDQNDKAELEQAAQQKNIKLHYFTKEK